MLALPSDDDTLTTPEDLPDTEGKTLEDIRFYYGESQIIPELEPFSNCIKVGDYLPYGPRLRYFDVQHSEIRMKDIGVKNRILVIGVLGSFTPECWNRHFFLVLKKLKYYEDRGVDYICCISTDDAYVHASWGEYLGCDEVVLMWADPYKNFTKAIGMDIIIPWLSNNVRSRRYVILAEDMEVTKMIVAPFDSPDLCPACEHLTFEESSSDTEDTDEESKFNNTFL